MHHITALDDGKIPGDNESRFRVRAKNLVDEWHQILNANKPPTDGQANGKLNKENTKDDSEDVVTKCIKNIDLNKWHKFVFPCLFWATLRLT